MFTVPLNTFCTDGLFCSCLYTTVHCSLLHNLTHLNTHLRCIHYAWISYTAVCLYFCSFSVNSGTVLLYNCTLASASLAYFLSTNHRRASIYLLRSDWSIRGHDRAKPNHSMLTTFFPLGKRMW